MRLFVLIFLVAVLQAGCAGQSELGRESGDAAQAPAPISERGQATYHLMLGEMALKRGQLDEAATQYRLAAELDSDPETADKAVELALMVGDQDEALLSARRRYELGPGEAGPARQYAGLLLEMDNAAAAVPVLRELNNINIASGEAHPELMMLSIGLEMDDSARALKTMKQVLGKRPDSAASMVVLSSLALVAGEDKEAERYAREAMEAEPDWNAAGMQLARVLVGTDRIDEGLEIARQQVAAGAGLSSRLDFAGLLSMVGKYSQAGLMLEQILLEHPGLPPALRMMGYVEYQVGRLENARRYYARLAASGRYTDEAYFYMGLIALDEGDTEAAAEILKLVPEGDFFLAAQFGVRDAYVTEGRPGEAMDYLDSIASAYPAYRVPMLMGKAELQAEQGNYPEAVALYSRALELAPDDTSVRYALAMTLEQNEQLDEAIEQLSRILKQEPGDATALNALGYTLADHGRDLRDAYRYIRKAYELEPNNPAVVDSMGWVEYRRGNNAKAIEYLRRAYELDADPEIAAHLGEVLWMDGARDEAREIWEEAAEAAPDHPVLKQIMERFVQ